jgi:hypothetical protein
LVAKRLRLLRELVPKAVRVAVLLNPDRVSIKPFDAVQIDNQGEDRFGSKCDVAVCPSRVRSCLNTGHWRA